MDSESRRFDDPGDGPHVHVDVPDYLREVIATVSHVARGSAHVNQRSGVSVRLSVTNLEVVAANALRRGLRGWRDDRCGAGRRPVGDDRQQQRQDRDRDARRRGPGRHLREPRPRRGAHRVPRPGAGRTDPRRDPGVRRGAVIDVGEDIPSAQLADQLATIPALVRPVEVLTAATTHRRRPPPPSPSYSRDCTSPNGSNKDVSERRASYELAERAERRR